MFPPIPGIIDPEQERYTAADTSGEEILVEVRYLGGHQQFRPVSISFG